MSEDKIIRAFPAQAPLPENTIVPTNSKDPKTYFCGHESISCDEHTRLVECTKCHATLDPFNFLLGNAKHLQRAWQHYEQTNKAISEINDRLQILNAEEKRLKARVKRLNDKTSYAVRGTDKL